MALVTSSVPLQLRDPQMARDQPRGFGRSETLPAAVVGRGGEMRRIGEIEEEPASAEESVYVALDKDYKEIPTTLTWALQNASREKTIVIVHIYRPSPFIPIMGGKFPASQLKDAQVRAYRQIEMEKMNNALDEYLSLCSKVKVRAKKLVIEHDDVGKGLVELISLHGINKLVMGAAADRHYSKKMKVPRSKTAITVQQKADPSCNIWFVCKGNLICTRGAGLRGYGITQSPAASSSTESSQPEELRSISLNEQRVESLNWIHSPMLAILRRRSISVNCDSHRGGIMSGSPVEGNLVTSIASTSSDYLASDISSYSASSEMLSNMGASPMPKNDTEEDMQFASARHELVDAEIFNDEVYDKLHDALKEAEILRREAYEESCRRQKAEKEAIEATLRAKTSENLYKKELKQRKEEEEALAREKMKLDKVKNEQRESFEELQNVRKQELALGLQIAEYDHMVKDLEQKLSAAQHLLESLQQENGELLRMRNDAVVEAEELCQMREMATTSRRRLINLSEFPYSELQQATNNFDESLKIGEGGFGSVYKCFLRHTMVAVKILKPESMQGQSEFHQEVDILSGVRHPHLVNLIGASTEALAIVYEYCINGSLEDRLVCKDNTTPLTWKARIRITAEICSALIFIHSNRPYAVVHGDLKPANILLDANYVSKLSDFGICRFLVQSTDTTVYHQTDPKGTFAYVDPEFLTSGVLTSSSDVYSFGVILLRLLTGRPALGVIKIVQDALNEGRLHGILDGTAGDWPFVQAKQLAHLALRCCEPDRRRRPDLAGEAWRVIEPMIKAAFPTGSSSAGSAPGDNCCIPSYFVCPIFQEIMNDPHIAADGFTYEAEALRGWLESGHDTSPMTNLKLPHLELIPNHALRSVIQEWLQQQSFQQR